MRLLVKLETLEDGSRRPALPKGVRRWRLRRQLDAETVEVEVEGVELSDLVEARAERRLSALLEELEASGVREIREAIERWRAREEIATDPKPSRRTLRSSR